jgi:hypothetical protein
MSQSQALFRNILGSEDQLVSWEVDKMSARKNTVLSTGEISGRLLLANTLKIRPLISPVESRIHQAARPELPCPIIKIQIHFTNKKPIKYIKNVCTQLLHIIQKTKIYTK